MEDGKEDFVGRHLIVDASTYTRRNLSSTDTVFALFAIDFGEICGRVGPAGPSPAAPPPRAA